MASKLGDTVYQVIRTVVVPNEDGSSSKIYRPGASVDLSDEQAGELLAAGKIQHVGATGTILDGVITEVELADTEGEKPLKANTVEELRDLAKSLGASEDSVKHLKKPELLEAIERLTHTSD